MRMSAPFSGGLEQTYHRRPSGPFGPAAVGATAVGVALAGALVWWLAAQRPFRVEVRGESMAPTFRPGDWAVAVRAGRPRPGDVVVLRHPLRPSVEMVKRVVAGPGDTAPGGMTLRGDEWFVAGDRRDASTDSRSLGPVPAGAVAGRVVLVYWPPARAGLVGSGRARGTWARGYGFRGAEG
jgi:nickel-type superoxide dismutase maturation protease